MICITSFHKDHWNVYANKFIESWTRCWPEDSTLYVYHQDCPVDHARIINIDLDKQENFLLFKNKTESLINLEQNKKTKNKYLKGLRWSHKVYAICDLILKTDEPVIWLDADTQTHKPIQKDIDKLLLAGYDLAVHVEIQNRMTHWETGLFVIAGTSEQRQQLVDNMLSIYDSGEVWNKPKTWDGHIWPECCTHMMCNDLNKDVKGRGYFQSKHVKGILTHAAGDKKFTKNNINKRSGRFNF